MAARKTKKSTSKNSEEGQSFEESMKRLSEIVEELEGGELTLEDSLKRFEEGVVLARTSQTRLDQAESRVEELLGVGDDGSIESQEIEE